MIDFFKMSGSGNDFILIDNRDQGLPVDDIQEFVKTVCIRKGSVGADGLILIEKSDRVDFRWRFFNADSSEVDMCGNGGRCAARYAYIKGIAGENLSFETPAGIIDAEIKGDIVKLKLPASHDLQVNLSIPIEERFFEVSYINTGVPHVVHFVNDLYQFDVVHFGRIILERLAGQFQENVFERHLIRVADLAP